MSLLKLRGGRVIDPTNGIDGVVRDVFIREGRIVEPAADDVVFSEIDATGCVVMAGGIDMHTHIGGSFEPVAKLLDRIRFEVGATQAAVGVFLSKIGQIHNTSIAAMHRHARLSLA
jgi:formylmethanofuran dehydrogenase subunit A